MKALLINLSNQINIKSGEATFSTDGIHFTKITAVAGNGYGQSTGVKYRP